jgi:uncharacterized protein
MKSRTKKMLLVLGGGALLLVAVAASQLPGIGAGAMLHPYHRKVAQKIPARCEAVTFKGDGVELQGWRSDAEGTRRGTLIYLHGVADNRVSGLGIMERFRKQGFDVLAYDSRAHGESGGAACTYGFHEKEDLRRVLDTLKPGPVVLIGSSLGAAVSLQTAAIDPRVTAVVAAEVFSDFRTVATERAPFFFTPGMVREAFRLAEEQAHFKVDEVSPVEAAKRIKVPVLIIHGAADIDTPPAHGQRVHDALAGPKRLLLVPAARHNESLSDNATWEEIEKWIDRVMAREELSAESNKVAQ